MGVLPELGDEARVRWVQLDPEHAVYPEISWSVRELRPPQDQVNPAFRT